MEDIYVISTTIKHEPIIETPAKSFSKSQNYAPVKNFQDQKFQNATMAPC